MFNALLGYALYLLQRGVSWVDAVFKMIGKYPEVPIADASRIANTAMNDIEIGRFMGTNRDMPLSEAVGNIIEGYESTAKILRVDPKTGNVTWGDRVIIYPYESLGEAIRRYVQEYNADLVLNPQNHTRSPEPISEEQIQVEWIAIYTNDIADLLEKYG